jgi:hypothetical protein
VAYPLYHIATLRGYTTVTPFSRFRWWHSLSFRCSNDTVMTPSERHNLGEVTGVVYECSLRVFEAMTVRVKFGRLINMYPTGYLSYKTSIEIRKKKNNLLIITLVRLHVVSTLENAWQLRQLDKTPEQHLIAGCRTGFFLWHRCLKWLRPMLLLVQELTTLRKSRQSMTLPYRAQV